MCPKGIPGGSGDPLGRILGESSEKWFAVSRFLEAFGHQKGGQKKPKGTQEGPREAQEPSKSAFGGVFFLSLFLDSCFIIFGPILGQLLVSKSTEKYVKSGPYFESLC